MEGLVGEAVTLLYSWGVFTVVLPFILFYTILYGLLQKTEIFGKNSENYNAMFSFALAFFTVYNFNITEGLPILISRVGLLFVLLIVIKIMAGFMGVDGGLDGPFQRAVIVTLLFAYLTYAVVDAFFDLSKILDFLEGIGGLTSIGAVGAALAVFGLIVWFVMRDSSSAESEQVKDVKKEEPKATEPKTRLQYNSLSKDDVQYDEPQTVEF